MSDSWLDMLAGRFIVFDGPDGSGKTTQMARFANLCASAGVPYCETREPGGTPIGERVRALLLYTTHVEITARCEMLLYMASRAQLVEQIIRPALARGELVLADRFTSSTLAYQGTAGGMPLDEIRRTAAVATGGLEPDLVVIFDVDERAAAKRLSPLLDRMESKGREFHARVREGYLEQARARPDQYLVVDATGDEEAVFASLVAGLRERLGAP